MGGSTSYGLGRGDTAARRGLLSAAGSSTRRVAEGATTKAEKARLLDDADHYDELAAKADRTGAEAEKS
jgi:hypothetical protein